jgi:hypothetical protein
VIYLLSNVPGLPPIVQTVHLVGIALVMASVVVVSLRTLGLIAKAQSASVMQARLLPWLWVALVVMLLSGFVFVLARPARYLYNPVFGIKLALLTVAVVAAFALSRLDVDSKAARAVAACSLVLWTGVVLAGRWIAYADYLFALP